MRDSDYIIIFTGDESRLPFLYGTIATLISYIKNKFFIISLNYYISEKNERLLSIIENLINISGNKIKFFENDPSMSLAAMKVYVLNLINSEWVYWFDDDIIIPEKSFNLVREVSECVNITNYLFSFCDVYNYRGYSDYDCNFKNPVDYERMSEVQADHAQFMLWNKDCNIKVGMMKGKHYSCSNSLLNLDLIKKSSLFSFWCSFKKGVRGHDSYFSEYVTEATVGLVFGANTFHIGLSTDLLDYTWKSAPLEQIYFNKEIK